MAEMTEGTLKAIVDSKITNSLGYYGDKLKEARLLALQYYNGEPFGNEEDGRSQVVSRDVAEAIDGMMPALMKIFTAGEEVVRFEPTRPEDEQIAKQATDYVNWIWNQQNPGYQIFFAWFKDALLNRTGIVKIYWDTTEETKTEKYKGLTDAELAMLMTHPDAPDDDIETVDQVDYPDPSVPPVLLMPGVEPPPRPMLHDITIRRTQCDGRVVIVPVPGEEFLIDHRAVSLEETPFSAHRVKKTLSELIEMGYPAEKVDSIGGEGDTADFDPERLERYFQEDSLPYREDSPLDPSMRTTWVTEAYIRVDFDGDGIAELRKVTTAGNAGALVLLDNEPIDTHPFAALSPIPMPHKFFGMSVADQTQDIQLVTSTLWRQALDNMYLANAPQIGAVEGKVNLDDLLTRRPGGVVRLKSETALVPIPNPSLGSEPFTMISYLAQVRAQRTGVQPFTAGPNSDVLNNAYTQTATGANIAENSSQERIELIARTFAETGVKAAMRQVLRLVSRYQQKPKIIRLRGQFVAMDPREWDTEFDMTVTVGLGTGNRSQQMQTMAMLLQMDQQIVQFQGGANGPLLTMEGIYNKLAKLIEFAGLKSADPYYTNPANAPPQPAQQPKPDPQIAKAQIEAQVQMQKASADIALRRELGLRELQLQAQRLGLDQAVAALQAQLDRDKLHADVALRHRSANADDAKQQSEDEFRRRTIPGYKAPRVAGVTLQKDAGGNTTLAHMHFDDGTNQPVQINRMIPGAPVQ